MATKPTADKARPDSTGHWRGADRHRLPVARHHRSGGEEDRRRPTTGGRWRWGDLKPRSARRALSRGTCRAPLRRRRLHFISLREPSHERLHLDDLGHFRRRRKAFDRDQHTIDRYLKIAGLRVGTIAWQLQAGRRRRPLRQDRHAVPTLLASPYRVITGLSDGFCGKLSVRGLCFLETDYVGLSFTKPVKQVRLPAVYVVDVEAGDLHRPFQASSRQPYRRNRSVRRLKSRTPLVETATESHLTMMSGRRRGPPSPVLGLEGDHGAARACAAVRSEIASASVTETDPNRLSLLPDCRLGSFHRLRDVYVFAFE